MSTGENDDTWRTTHTHTTFTPTALSRVATDFFSQSMPAGTLPPTFTQRRTNSTRSHLPTSLRKHRGIFASTTTAATAAEQDQRPPSTNFKTRNLPLPTNYKGPPANSRASSSVRCPPQKRPRTSLSVLRNGTVSEVQAGSSALLPSAWNTTNSFQGPNRGDLAGDNSGKEWSRSGSAATSRPYTYGGISKVCPTEKRSGG